MAAVDAVAAFARDVARLPSFPLEPWLQWLNEREEEDIATVALLKPVTTDAIHGAVLPSTHDTWLALLPFHDLNKNVPEATKRDLIQKRRAFVSLLATLATSSSRGYRWDSATIDCGESAHPEQATTTFWLDLLRELSPESAHDTAKELTRHLIAMTQEHRPRFLLGVRHDVTSGDFPELLAQFLSGDGSAEDDVRSVVETCGVRAEPTHRVTVDVCLSFAKGKISHTFLTKVLHAIENSSSSLPVQFRVTSVRFGWDCSFQAKAMELLDQRPLPPSIQHLRLGSVGDIKPASLRVGLHGILRSVRHLGVASFDAFRAVASALRNHESSVDVLDVAFEPTIDNAVWIAFGLFHADTRTNISSLRLRVPRIPNHPKHTELLTTEWLETFKRVLASTTAERDLADMDDDSESQSENARDRRFVKMKKGTAIKSDPYAGAKLLCKVEDEAEEFEVIAQVDKFLAIVLTGHGVGWAPGVSVASERTVTTLLTGETKMNRNIKTLMWDSGAHPCHTRASGWGERAFNAHLETLISFLEVVGEPLERLHVPEAQLTTEHLARILAACPNLKELNVSGHEMESIAPLRDAYATGNCHISTLSIARTDARYLRGTTNPELIEILRGPGGQTLRHLAVHLLPPLWGTGWRDTYVDEWIHPILDLVGRSSTLAYVQLPGSGQCEHVSGFTHPIGDEGIPVYQPECELPVDVSQSPFCFAPMRLRSKLAFLSCLHDHSSAKSRLDTSVLSVIFSFGAESIPRRVLMHAPLALERCSCCWWRPHRAMAHDLPHITW